MRGRVTARTRDKLNLWTECPTESTLNVYHNSWAVIRANTNSKLCVWALHKHFTSAFEWKNRWSVGRLRCKSQCKSLLKCIKTAVNLMHVGKKIRRKFIKACPKREKMLDVYSDCLLSIYNPKFSTVSSVAMPKR